MTYELTIDYWLKLWKDLHNMKKLKRKKRLSALKQAIKDSSKFRHESTIDRWQFIEQRTDELLGEYKWK